VSLQADGLHPSGAPNGGAALLFAGVVLQSLIAMRAINLSW
jgi:hypothetical protein